MSTTKPSQVSQNGVAHSHQEEALTKRDDAAIGVAQQHNLTIRDVLRNHKRIVFWCIFFSMSAVGWGFDAQVNGAMISVPAFRETFGYVQI